MRQVRTSRSVDLPSRLKNPPGILPGGVKIFAVIDGEWKKVESFSLLFGRAGCHQQYGIAVADDCGAIGLFCQLADFDREFAALRSSR